MNQLILLDEASFKVWKSNLLHQKITIVVVQYYKSEPICGILQ